MEIFDQQVKELQKLWKNKRQLAHQILNLGLVVASAFMIWKFLMTYTRSESPVVVVLSGSMEPAFQRGDILFLDNNKPSMEIGDICVFKIKGREIPIVHRVLNIHRRAKDLEDFYLTKGDNNNIHDRGLYAPGQRWLSRTDIIGVARGSVPYVGMVTIILNDYPALKILLVGIMASNTSTLYYRNVNLLRQQVLSTIEYLNSYLDISRYRQLLACRTICYSIVAFSYKKK